MNTEVQDKYVKLLERFFSLPGELVQMQSARFYENETPLIDWVTLECDLESYFDSYSGDFDYQDLSKEVVSNLHTFGRDAQEFFYLRAFDEFLRKVRSTTNLVLKESRWSNAIEKAAIDSVFDELSPNRKVTYEVTDAAAKQQYHAQRLIRNVQGYCRQINAVCRGAAQKANDSMMVSNQPERFSNIISFNSRPEQAPAPIPIAIEQELTEPDKGLSAAQKLLLIRLLQKESQFPCKPANTDDAPELRAIALLTGLSYDNQIKGSKGAKAKVDQLMNDKEREALTIDQAKPKLADLDAIEKVARLLNADSVVNRINQYRKDLNKIIQS